MVKELMNVLRIDNGFVVTSAKRDSFYCADEEAVAAHIRLKLAEFAEEETAPKANPSAISLEEWEQLKLEQLTGSTNVEGTNA